MTAPSEPRASSEPRTPQVRSTEETDLMSRSTKKVKILGKEDPVQSSKEDMIQADSQDRPTDEEMPHVSDGSLVSAPKGKEPISEATPSYKDMVMSVGGYHNVGEGRWDLGPEEIVQMVTEEVCPELFVNEGQVDPTPSFNPKPKIEVAIEEYDEWCRPWHNTLIVNILGKKVGLRYMTNKLQYIWSKGGAVQVMDMSNGYFLVHFADEGDYKHALFEGPWRLLDHYLVVQRWRPFFKSSDHQVGKIAVWIRIPDLPVELFNSKFLWRVEAKLGTMLKIDELTSLQRELVLRLIFRENLSLRLLLWEGTFVLSMKVYTLSALGVENTAIERKLVLRLALLQRILWRLPPEQTKF